MKADCKHLLIICFFLFPLFAFSAETGVRIVGNLRFEKPDKGWADAFCFFYNDLLSGKPVIVPVQRDANGNFDMVLPIADYQQIKLGGAINKNGKVLYTPAMSWVSFFGMKGQTVGLYLKKDGGQINLKFAGDLANENQEYKDFDSAFGREKSSDRGYYNNPLVWRKNKTAVKLMMHNKLKEQLKFHTAYFKEHKASEFIKKQVYYDLIYTAAQDAIQLVSADIATDSMIVDFFKAINQPVTVAEAFGNDSYYYLMDSYYTALKRNAPLVKPDFSGLENFVDSQYADVSEKDLQLIKRISRNIDIKSDNDIMPARQYMDDYMMALQLKSDFMFFSQLKDLYLRDFCLSRLLYKMPEGNIIDHAAPYLTDYKMIVQDTHLKTRFLMEHQKQLSILNSSKLSAKSILYLAEDLPSDFIKSVFEKYRGKVVYVDVWATWCAPCIAGMPDSKNLRQELEGKDVEFLYVCIDSPNSGIWKNLIAAKEIEGENYFLDFDQSEEFKKKFGIGPIPHHMILNKKGELVNAKAEGPSNAIVKNEIEKLLAE